MSQLQSVVSMSAQTVTTIAHTFHIFIKPPWVDDKFRWDSVCFEGKWDWLDVLLSSNLSSKKVMVNTVPTSSGARVELSVGLSSLPFFFNLSFEPLCHSKHPPFVQSLPIKHAGLMDIYS